MFTNQRLPSNGLMALRSVNIDMEFKAPHHEKLLKGTDELYERTVFSVIQDLCQGDISQIALPDLMFLFFNCRANTLGFEYTVPWTCQRLVRHDGSESECGKTNLYVFDIGKMAVNEIPENYSYPKYNIQVNEDIAECFVRMLTCVEEFEIFEDFLSRGISREELYEKHAYEYGDARLIKSLTFSAPKYSTFIASDKEKILKDKGVSFKVISGMYKDLSKLGECGSDLSPRDVKCQKCGGVSRLGIPFSISFLVQS